MYRKLHAYVFVAAVVRCRHLRDTTASIESTNMAARLRTQAGWKTYERNATALLPARLLRCEPLVAALPL